MYKTVLFDLDGTLMDSGPGIINSIKYALDKIGAPFPAEEVFYKFIGPPLLDSYGKYCNLTGDIAWEALELYREYFSTKGAFENSVYDGIEECLVQLRDAGKRLIIATSKPEIYAVDIVRHFGLDKYFDFVAGASMDETCNKKPDVIRYALERAGICNPSEVVMVGDRSYDVTGAAELGMDSIGVLYGYGSLKELEDAGATFTAKTPREIAGVILR
ncbi:MAG: HAD family hydrolase [Lachnospiraceae bacterium]|jgi:phosphoglycolate phosphatase